MKIREKKARIINLPSASVVLVSSLVVSSTAVLVLKHAKKLEFKLMRKKPLQKYF